MIQIGRHVRKHSPSSSFQVAETPLVSLTASDVPPSRQNSNNAKQADGPVYLKATTAIMDGVKVAQSVDILMKTGNKDSSGSPQQLAVLARITTILKKEVVPQPQKTLETTDLLSCAQLNVVTDHVDTYSNPSRNSDYSEPGYVSDSTISSEAFSPSYENRLLHTRSRDALNAESPDIPSRTGSYNGSTIRVNSHDSFNFASHEAPAVSRRSSAASFVDNPNMSTYNSMDESKTLTTNPVPREYNLYDETRIKQWLKRFPCASWDPQLDTRCNDGDYGSILQHAHKQHRSSATPSSSVELETTQTQVVQEVDNILLQQLGLEHPGHFEAVVGIVTMTECATGDDSPLSEYFDFEADDIEASEEDASFI
jgi:hypothetical protein